MKRILFPTLLIATLLAGGAVAFAIWRSSPTTPEDFVKEAKKLYEQKDYATAAIHLLQAVQQDPRNREARFLLVDTYVNRGDLQSAARQLQSFLDYVPDDREASLKLGNLYLRDAAAYGEINKITQKLLEKNDKDVDALILQGNVNAGLRKLPDSREDFQKATALDPNNPAALVGLGTTQALQQNFPEAEKAFLKAKELDPKNLGALYSLGHFYIATKDAAKAEATFKEALALYPKEPRVYGSLAELYFVLGRFDDVTKLLESTQALAPMDPTPSFMLANSYVRRNQVTEARKVLLDLKSKKEFAENLDIAKRLAVAFMNDEPTRSQMEIDQILKARPKDPEGLLLQGRLQFQLKEYDKAKATLSEPQALNSGQPEVFLLLGNIEARKNNLNLAIENYQKALTLAPNYVVARVALASGLLDKGQISDARAEMEKVSAVTKNYPPARLINAAIARSEKRYAESERELSALIKEQPSSADIHDQMARTQLAMGRSADAEKTLLRTLELDPNSYSRVEQLTRFYIETKQPEKAIQKVGPIADQEQKAQYFELLAAVYASMGKVPEAEANYKKALEKDPKGSNADAALANLYIQTGRLPEALQKLNEVIQKNPNNAGAYATRGMLYETQGKTEDAKTNYRRALDLDANSDVAANNLAYMLAEEGKDLESALAWAQGVKRRNPESPAIADTLGWVYYKYGNYTLARDQMLFAISKDANNPTFYYHLGMIYKELKQTREAAEALRKASNNPKDFKEKTLAQAALKEVAP
jgi:tetratricopeptide (TPR) repeat protein